jgi:hypothetical protein
MFGRFREYPLRIAPSFAGSNLPFASITEQCGGSACKSFRTFSGFMRRQRSAAQVETVPASWSCRAITRQSQAYRCELRNWKATRAVVTNRLLFLKIFPSTARRVRTLAGFQGIDKLSQTH